MGIYTTEDVDRPFLESYLFSCILSESREYNHLEIWGFANGDYVSRTTKESSFRSPLHIMIHHLIASTIHHRQEHDKVPIGDLFPMWCLLYTDVHLHIPYTIVSFISSSLALGAQPQSMICGGHFISRLARSYEIDTNGITHYPIMDLDEGALKRIRVIEHGTGQIWRVPLEDFSVPILQLDLENGEEHKL